MKNHNPISGNKIIPMPLDNIVAEGSNQKERIVKEVMEALFAKLPDNTDRGYDFQLSDGTKCWIKRFSPPGAQNDEFRYGFDVKFSEGHALSHLEFLVKCSGWERVLDAPTQE